MSDDGLGFFVAVLIALLLSAPIWVLLAIACTL